MSNLSIFPFSFPSIFLLLSSCFLHLLLSHLLVHFRFVSFSTSPSDIRRTPADPRSLLHRPKLSDCRLIHRTHTQNQDKVQKHMKIIFDTFSDIARVSL